jgi:hypothetical protein
MTLFLFRSVDLMFIVDFVFQLDDLSVALRALYTPEKFEGLETSELEGPIDRCASNLFLSNHLMCESLLF